MILQELLNQNVNPFSYKPIDPATVDITGDELELIKREFLKKKIAAINSENYLKAVNAQPIYKVPPYIEMYNAAIEELTVRYGWVIDQWNEYQIKQICAYFSGDEGFLLMDENFSFKKSLIIVGPVGCGKSTLLKVFQRNPFNPFRFVSCRKVADEYAEFGSSAVANYSVNISANKRDWYGHENISICFDDLGTESEKKNFGNQVNVMAEIILNRYDNIEAKNKTFVTTNLIPDQIKRMYGERASSRMREMFNVIEFDLDSPDRRK